MMKVFQRLAECGFAVVIALALCSFPAVAQDSTPTFKTLYTFSGGADGSGPQGPLALAPDGSLYGTTLSGGSVCCGTVYHLVPSSTGWSEHVLYSFTNGADGYNPGSGVLLGPSGVLYGTTGAGGSFGGGIAFSLAPPATPGGPWIFTVIHSFGGALDGAFPYGGLTAGTDGDLYGTTEQGGASLVGTIYRLAPPAVAGQPWSETILYNFTGGADGFSPNKVTLTPHGTIYGTAIGPNRGLVFRLLPPDANHTVWTQEVLYSFTGLTDGNAPSNGVVLDSAGSVYGVTFDGGTTGTGIAYKLAPPEPPATIWNETILYSFGEFTGDSVFPEFRPVLGAGGVLLGTALGYFSSSGTAYMLKPPTATGGAWTESILHNFRGGMPWSSLTIGASGELYGTTVERGLAGGTVYMLR